jgi:hypothetical protein
MNSRTDTFIQVQTKDGLIEPIRIWKWVKHGCIFSLILFNIRVDPLIRYLRREFLDKCFKYPIKNAKESKVMETYADNSMIFLIATKIWKL